MTTSGEVDISVVIPAYNRETMVGEAIASALAQETPGGTFEVIVVDDASTDGTLAVLRAYEPRIRVLSHSENRGGGAARNTGIRAARGEYIALLDSDDLMLPGRLAAQLAFLRAHPDVGVATGANIDEGISDGTDYWATRGLDIPPGEWLILEKPRPFLCRRFIGSPSSTTFRRSLAIQAGLNSEDPRLVATDWLFNIVLAGATAFACQNRPVGFVRHTAPNQSSKGFNRTIDPLLAWNLALAIDDLTTEETTLLEDRRRHEAKIWLMRAAKSGTRRDYVWVLKRTWPILPTRFRVLAAMSTLHPPTGVRLHKRVPARLRQ